MTHTRTGNLLMVSNYPSDTAYAWWLMEHFWTTLAEQFISTGSKAYLAYPKIRSLSEKISVAPIEPVELSIPWKTKEQALRALNFIREKSISSIYLTDQHYFSSQHIIMRLCGVRRIIIHDHTPGDRSPVQGLKGTLKTAKNSIPWFTANCVLCVSELMRQRNLENARIPANKCVVVQNGIPPVDCARYKSDAPTEYSGAPPNCFRVITTGRANAYKRFDFIINCADALSRRAPELDVIFLIAGDGPAMPELQAQVHRLGLDNKVNLLGFCSDVRGLLCTADLAIHAALGEGFSLSIIEYMSAGLPVMVPDIPSVSQAVLHNKTGIIYPKDDVEAVASHIHGLAIDTNRRKSMGKSAKIHADSTYNIQRCTQDFINATKTAYNIDS